MIDFLVFVGSLKGFLVVDAGDIEKDVPVGSTFALLEAVALEGVDDAPVLRAYNFVGKGCFFQTDKFFGILL